EDSAALRRVAIFDIVANNADRKGGHVLAMPDGHRHGVDHGLTFHVEHKLRTVLWGWADEELHTEERARIEQLREGLDSDLGRTLAEFLTATELTATAARCEHLRHSGRLPAPQQQMPMIPWPPF